MALWPEPVQWLGAWVRHSLEMLVHLRQPLGTVQGMAELKEAAVYGVSGHLDLPSNVTCLPSSLRFR